MTAPTSRLVSILCPAAHAMPPTRIVEGGAAVRITCLDCGAVVETTLYRRDDEWHPTWKWIELPKEASRG